MKKEERQRIQQRIQELESRKIEIESELESIYNSFQESKPSWNDWGIYWLKIFVIPSIFLTPLILYDNPPLWLSESIACSALVLVLYLVSQLPITDECVELNRKWTEYDYSKKMGDIDYELDGLKKEMSPILLYPELSKSSSKPKKKHWWYNKRCFRITYKSTNKIHA